MISRALPIYLFIFLISISLWGWVLYRGRTWQQDGQRAVLLLHPATSEVTTPLTLVIWKPHQRSLLMLKLPEELMFQASHNRESYALNTLPRLAEIEGWSERQWLREVSLQLGVIIDGTLQVSVSQAEINPDRVISQSRNSLWLRNGTSLQWWDRLTWWRGISGTSSLQREVIAWDAQWLDENKEINQAFFDRQARLQLQDDIVRRSQWAVRVLNASGVSGDAGRQARLLEIVGFNVLTIDNQDAQVKSTLRLDTKAVTDPESLEAQWAVERIRLLYSDWPNETSEGLRDQKRVEAEVIQGVAAEAVTDESQAE